MVRICLQCRRSWFDSWVGKIPWRRDRLPTPIFLGFPCGSAGKESACNAGDLGSIPRLGRSPGEVKGYPLQCSGLENSMDFYILRGRKELDLSEQLSRFTFTRKLPCQAPETEWLSYYQLLLLPKPISPFSKWGTVDKLWFASVWMSTRHALLWKPASTNSNGFLDTNKDEPLTVQWEKNERLSVMSYFLQSKEISCPVPQDIPVSAPVWEAWHFLSLDDIRFPCKLNNGLTLPEGVFEHMFVNGNQKDSDYDILSYCICLVPCDELLRTLVLEPFITSWRQQCLWD